MLFKKNPHQTHFDIFSHLFPEVAEIYSNLSDEPSSESKYASLRRSFSLTKKLSISPYDPQSPQLLMKCIEALTKEIFPSLSGSQQESFLKTLFCNFPDLSSLELTNIQLKEIDLSNILSNSNSLKELILKEWKHITGAMLLSFLSDFSQSKLCITPESLSSQDWKDILAFSWQEKRNLVLLFPNESCPTTKENRFILIGKALEVPYFSLAQALLELNAEICKGCPPLHFAAMQNNEALTEYLLEHNADFSSYQRNNPIHVAALYGSIKVLKVFQKKIPDIFYGVLKAPNSKGELPLHKSAQNPIPEQKINSKKDVVAFLLNHTETLENRQDQEGELNLNIKDYEGYTPLHYAVKSGDLETLQFLEECGGNLEVLGKDKKSLLHLAVLAHDLTITHFLIEKKCNPNHQDSFGQTPLIMPFRWVT
jgi:ankyrin repeat protein